MKVYKKNVFIGDIAKCVEISKSKNLDKKMGAAFRYVKTKTNIIVIKTNDDTFVELDDLLNTNLPTSLARKAVPQLKLTPERKGNYFVNNICNYYNKKTYEENEKIDIKDILGNSKTL